MESYYDFSLCLHYRYHSVLLRFIDFIIFWFPCNIWSTHGNRLGGRKKTSSFCSYLFMVAVGASRKECFLFLKYLALLGAVVAILSIVEVVLGGGIIFSNYYAIGQERAGRLRIHVGTFLVLFSIVYSFIKYQHLPNKFEQQHLIYLIVLFLGLYTIGFIVMTRADMIGLFFIFILWFGRKKLSNNKIMLLCATVSIIPIFSCLVYMR